LNSKGRRHEKRARQMLTRPEPTSNGNCDSWEFIVGKKAKTPTQQWPKKDTLQMRHRNLSTVYQQFL
jgi:hypothetical protein